MPYVVWWSLTRAPPPKKKKKATIEMTQELENKVRALRERIKIAGDKVSARLVVWSSLEAIVARVCHRVCVVCLWIVSSFGVSSDDIVLTFLPRKPSPDTFCNTLGPSVLLAGWSPFFHLSTPPSYLNKTALRLVIPPTSNNPFRLRHAHSRRKHTVETPCHEMPQCC